MLDFQAVRREHVALIALDVRRERKKRGQPELQTYSGRTIDVPSCYIAGANDWGIYQFPGYFEKMQTTACKRMLSVHLVEHAGHWVQQEQPTATTRLLLEFLQQAKEHRAG